MTYTDTEGRRWRVRLPDGAPDSDARLGVPLGPPPLDLLGLPIEFEVRLHNELHDRGLLTERDFKRNPQEIEAAVKFAFRVDFATLFAAYRQH